MSTAGPAELRLHGDTIAAAAQLDFAVNVVPGGPPAWLRRELHAALGRVAGYPDDRPAAEALAARHHRPVGEVVCANGSAEALWLLASVVRPSLAVGGAAVVHRARSGPARRRPPAPAGLAPPGRRRPGPGRVPRDADLVVVGNPNNPTGNLDPAATVAGLARPGRVLVVDEAFMELTPGETESLAGRRDLPGLVVVRSLTKLWGLAGLRAGYVLAPEELAAALREVLLLHRSGARR